MNAMNWREYFKLTLGYVGILLFIFFTIDIVHFKFFHPKIVLHAIVLDTILTMIFSVMVLKVTKIITFNAIFLTNACIIFSLLALLYNVLGPTMCDRSLSVFLLIKLKEAEEAHKIITVNDLVQITNEQYVRGSHMVEKRLIDHQSSGAIQVNNGIVTLTPSGELAADTFETLYWIQNIPKTF